MDEDTLRIIYSDYGPTDLQLRKDKLYMYKEGTWNTVDHCWEHIFYETGWWFMKIEEFADPAYADRIRAIVKDALDKIVFPHEFVKDRLLVEFTREIILAKLWRLL